MAYQTIIMWIAIALAAFTVTWTQRQLIQKNWNRLRTNLKKVSKNRKLDRAKKVFDALSTSKSSIYNLKTHYTGQMIQKNRINNNADFIYGIINMTDEPFVKNLESVIMGVLKREKLIDVEIHDLDIVEKDEEPTLGYGTMNVLVKSEGNKLIKMIPGEE